jgi:Flp pilus assembly protein TadG
MRRGERMNTERATDNRERGAVLPLMAILLVVLMGAVAMAIDLGWLYWQSIEIQHGADSAALAGVVYEPDFRTDAHTEATGSAKQNGFDAADAATTVEVYDKADGGNQVQYDNQLRVTITHKVDTFFLALFGLNDVDIRRTSVAQYTPPVLMGSPEATFGRDYSQYAPGSASDPGYWGSISGTYGPASWGDLYASPCKDKVYIGGTDYGSGYGLIDPDGNPCVITDYYRTPSNPGLQSATGGYLYGIHVDSAPSGLSVEVFDGPTFNQRRYGKDPDSDDWTGDYVPKASTSIYHSFGPPDLDVEDEFITYFMLYGPDTTPLITSDNELLCVVSYNSYNDAGTSSPADDDGGREQYYGFWDPSWSEFSDVPAANINMMWEDMATQGGCGSLDRGPGIYPLRVMMWTPNPDGWACPGLYATGGCPYAFNKYSLRVSASSGSPTISALQDMSIFANDVDTASTDFYLAEVDPKYAGKDLVVEFFDAGDLGGNPGSSDTVEVLAGNGDTLDCTWIVYDLDGDTDENGTGCSFLMKSGSGGSRYDNRIVQFTIALPESYTCSGDTCWFRAKYNYTGTASFMRDVTTWSAYIDGNPIRIVE